MLSKGPVPNLPPSLAVGCKVTLFRLQHRWGVHLSYIGHESVGGDITTA